MSLEDSIVGIFSDVNTKVIGDTIINLRQVECQFTLCCCLSVTNDNKRATVNDPAVEVDPATSVKCGPNFAFT